MPPEGRLGRTTTQAPLLRLLGNDRVLQSATHNVGRVDDAGLHQVQRATHLSAFLSVLPIRIGAPVTCTRLGLQTTSSKLTYLP